MATTKPKGKAKGKGKAAPKGISGKVNAEYGIGPVKLPLWGWGAVAVGGVWFYLHFIRPSNTAASSGAGGGGYGHSLAPVGGGGGGGGSFPPPPHKGGHHGHHHHKHHGGKGGHTGKHGGKHNHGLFPVGPKLHPKAQGFKPGRMTATLPALRTESSASSRRASSGTLGGQPARQHHRPGRTHARG